MLVLAIIWCMWLKRNSIIFRNQCRNLSSLFCLQSLGLVVMFLLSGHESEVFSQAIQYMQQKWDQVQANQAAHAIAISISIFMATEAAPGALNPAVEFTYDPLATFSNDSGN